MTSHFKFHSGVGEVVPWNARYAYPSQANKIWKSTVKIPTKNGSTYSPGQYLRFEFPATGYLNPLNTQLEMDVKLTSGTTNGETFRFQNNIQSIFRRVRILYGSLVIEDIQDYNLLCRFLTEHTATSSNAYADQTSITEGIGGLQQIGDTGVPENVRQIIHGVTSGNGSTTDRTRRYVVNLALGLLTQSKLIPLKFLASQVTIEIELAPAAQCIVGAAMTTAPTYEVQQPNMIVELLEFDGTYDAAFLMGLKEGGVPIKFSTYHTWRVGSPSANKSVFNINERSRSVKAAFALLVASADAFTVDNGASVYSAAKTSGLNEFQWRIGGKYYPSQPVTCGSGGVTNGAAEAYSELQKALNIVGDYRLSTSANPVRWTSMAVTDYAATANTSLTTTPFITEASWAPANFVISVDLESTNGVDISGLNAEEQNDIALTVDYKAAQTNYTMVVFTYFDAMLILREGNIVDLIM